MKHIARNLIGAILALAAWSACAQIDVRELAARCAPGVPPETLAAIVAVESAGNPYAINISYQAQQLPRQPREFGEAVRIAKELMSAGKNISIGLGQINTVNFDKLGLTVEDLFDPCTNLRAAGIVLGWSYAEALKSTGPGQRALAVALSYYNSGNSRVGFANGYVWRVYRSAK